MTQEHQLSLFEGRKARDEALTALEDTTENRKRWVETALAFAIRHAIAYGTVTSDDVRRALPIPEGWDPRIMGAVFNAKRKGFPLRKAGYKQTTFKQAHARPIPIWALR